MITKSDWIAVHAEMLAEERQRLGDPPTSEEMLAYVRGELSADEEERIREALVCHPELARTLTVPFLCEEARPEDELSEEEWGRHWTALQRRMPPPAQTDRVLQFWRVSAALAAGLALVFGGLLWRANAKLIEPRLAFEEYLLMPEGQRGPGGGPTTFAAEGEAILVVAAMIGQPHYRDYRVEIVRPQPAPARKVWSATGLRRRDDDTFAILIPRAFLEPAQYRIVVYGLEGARAEPLATYPFRVPAR